MDNGSWTIGLNKQNWKLKHINCSNREVETWKGKTNEKLKIPWKLKMLSVINWRTWRDGKKMCLCDFGRVPLSVPKFWKEQRN